VPSRTAELPSSQVSDGRGGEIVARATEPGTIDHARQDAALLAAFGNPERAQTLLCAPLADVGVHLASSARFVGPGRSRARPPATCADWIRLEDGGVSLDVPNDDSEFDLHADRVCRGLEIAARSQLATRSTLAGFRVADGYGVLPLTVSTLTYATGTTIGSGARLSDGYPPPREDGDDALDLCALPERDGERTCLRVEELGRADVDRDGAEDLVVFSVGDVADASDALVGRVLVLARSRASENFRVIDAAPR
jgi:hypothetical protein